MTELIKQLNKEHAEIEKTLNKVKELGVNTQEGQQTLMAAKDGLLAHLKKEDEELYPVLYKAAEKDEKLKRTLEVFAKDMEGISKAALEFFEKYANGGSGIEFARDFGKLLAVLSQRISKEENVLYKKYEEIVSGA